MRRMKIRGILIRSIGGSIQFPFGIMNYLHGNYEAAIINFAIGFLIIATFLFLPGHKRTQKILGTPFICIWLLIKPIVNFIGKYFKKKEEITHLKKAVNKLNLRWEAKAVSRRGEIKWFHAYTKFDVEMFAIQEGYKILKVTRK